MTDYFHVLQVADKDAESSEDEDDAKKKKKDKSESEVLYGACNLNSISHK